MVNLLKLHYTLQKRYINNFSSLTQVQTKFVIPVLC
ncbi:hypothetical protein BvCmsNSNP040_00698 [Escherichia coli]|nr:hypothetical protein BvCmsNSNP040_00698 [Escherichia coli]